MKTTFKKVLAINGNIRYIDTENNWWHKKMNGKINKSKPMPVVKVYGDIEFDVVDEGIYGLRATTININEN